MRTTNEIITAVKEGEPVTERELKLALVALSSIDTFRSRTLNDLIDAIEKGSKPILDLKVAHAKDQRERLFTAAKTDPEVWLGPCGTPGTPEHTKSYNASKRIMRAFLKYQGLDEEGKPLETPRA